MKTKRSLELQEPSTDLATEEQKECKLPQLKAEPLQDLEEAHKTQEKEQDQEIAKAYKSALVKEKSKSKVTLSMYPLLPMKEINSKSNQKKSVLLLLKMKEEE